MSIQLKAKHQFRFAGYYIAKEKGYYEKAGLDVKIKEFKEGINVVDDVLSGKSTYGVNCSSLVHDRIENKKVVALAAILQHSPVSLIIPQNSNIKTITDLKNKKIMQCEKCIKNCSILCMLAKDKVYPKDIQIVRNCFSIKDFIDKKADAYAVYLSDQPYQLKKKNIQYNLFTPCDYGFDFYGDMIFTSEEELKKNPQRTRKFIEATLKGWRYAFDHIDETIELILKKYNTQKRSYDALFYEADILKKFSGIKEGNFGEINQEKIKSIVRIHSLIGSAEGEIDLEKFIYKSDRINLSKNQKAFIDTHLIKCIMTTTWSPFNMENKTGDIEGIAIDYWNLIAKKTGIKYKYVKVDVWGDVLEGIKNKKADITVSTTITKDRLGYSKFSKPYVSFPIAIATTDEKGFIAKTSHLNGRKVALGKDYSAHKILKEHYPDIDFVLVKNIDKGGFDS